MDNNHGFHKQAIVNQHELEEANNFYKLHYPAKKSPPAISKASNKMRSKSVVSVLQSPPNHQQFDLYCPKGSIRKMVANRQNNSHNSQNSRSVPKKQKQPSKHIQNLSFKSILSAKTTPRDLHSVSFPVNSLKELQQLSKKNINVKLALQRTKDQKIKMNKIVMSHKQNQQVKLQYLKNKRQETQNMINQEINSIYEEFFKREYEEKFGVEEGEDRFQVRLAELVTVMARKVFYSN